MIKGVFMRLSGWIFMLTAWTMIISLMIFCFSTIIRKGADVSTDNQTKVKKQKGDINE